MSIDAVGSATAALTQLNPTSNAKSGTQSTANTTTVTTAPDGAVTTTVTAPNGTVISITVTQPATPQNQASNGNALLDIKV